MFYVWLSSKLAEFCHCGDGDGGGGGCGFMD